MSEVSQGLPADRYVRAFTSQLHGSGVEHVVVCPGSRSTPLTLAFVRDDRFRAWLHLDERSAGYFALGLARQLRQPVALVCTSGTAAANFLPAVVEASLSRVPLVVLTADRPPELRDVGASQTIDQVRLYGSHARWSVDMPLADGSAALERTAAAVAARAAATAVASPPGPVHVNFPFREPLVGPRPATPAGPERAVIEATRPAEAPPLETVRRFLDATAGKRGLIVCGPEAFGLPARDIVALGAALGWSVLADPLSGLRAGRHDLAGVVETYDALVRDEAFAARQRPEMVLRFGASPTSKALNVWLAETPALRSYVVDAAGGWRDPDATASAMLRGDPAALCQALLAGLRGAGPGAQPATAWRDGWVDANRRAGAALREAVDAIDEPFEGRAAVELAEALPDGATLVCGNSMPVRDVDSFLPRLDRDLRIVGTRGAAGIDGVVSTAVGAAAAGSGPVVLLIGDLSFFHDLNGLWALRRHGLDLTVLLVNNDGGGIFHFLPQAELAADVFEQWFGTPHGLDFRAAVELHGGSYERLEGNRGWTERIAASIASPGLSVLELRTDRVRNVELHRQVWARVSQALHAGVAAGG